jgi:DNA processing protein
MLKARLLIPLNKEYPKNLKDFGYCPPIYIRGKILPKDNLAVAIIGSRQMSKYGIKVAYRFAFTLAKSGITIVSGLARGIDTVSHEASLDAGGRTLAVLGSGLDVIYPPENINLAKKIEKNGAVLSQFPLHTKPLGKNFLARNRIIAALSKALVVVEGAKRSGTLSTASYAANMGREVFAIPGPIDSLQSQAPNYLIEQGAFIATKPEYIIEYLRSIT